mmetsp:Transcript_9042/g.27437  ORF Transcript_9042/g.27437 Transcript_9042/m.27437 type:complete len:317 (+) Transcript_9042:1315-2265(+)
MFSNHSEARIKVVGHRSSPKRTRAMVAPSPRLDGAEGSRSRKFRGKAEARFARAIFLTVFSAASRLPAPRWNLGDSTSQGKRISRSTEGAAETITSKRKEAKASASASRRPVLSVSLRGGRGSPRALHCQFGSGMRASRAQAAPVAKTPPAVQRSPMLRMIRFPLCALPTTSLSSVKAHVTPPSPSPTKKRRATRVSTFWEAAHSSPASAMRAVDAKYPIRLPLRSETTPKSRLPSSSPAKVTPPTKKPGLGVEDGSAAGPLVTIGMRKESKAISIMSQDQDRPHWTTNFQWKGPHPTRSRATGRARTSMEPCPCP